MDKYDVIKIIGTGSFGKAYLCRHRKDKQQYVMKKMDISDPDTRKTAETELEHLKSLNDQYIVAYRESFVDKNEMCLVMEYCEGGDLAGVIVDCKRRKEKLPETQILTWTLQICLGLKYLHEHDVIHRDLKPPNIFLSNDKKVKLGDFGIARRLSPGDLAKTLVGTPLYISPEIVRNEPYNKKVDVWALGCCVYEMMTFETAVNALVLMLQQQWVIGAMPVGKYSSELTTLTDLMLTIDGDERPSIQEILASALMQETQRRMDGGSASAHSPKKRALPAASVPVASPATPHAAAVRSLSDITCGFTFNAEGKLRELATDKPFEYDVLGDRIRNEQRYQDIAQSVTRHIQDKLMMELKMMKVFLPVDAKKDEAQSYVFITSDWQKKAKLMILIQGNGAPRAGEWARKVIINDSLDAGSQLPWVKRGISEGYALLLLNPNLNSVTIGDKQVPVRDNDSSAKHVMYVWDHIIARSPIQAIAIVAHSYGGINTLELAKNRKDAFLDRVKAVAFTDSSHKVDKDVPKEIGKFLPKHAKHWVSSDKPLDTQIESKKHDAPKVSAGDKRHEWTTWASFNSIFTFFKSQIK